MRYWWARRSKLNKKKKSDSSFRGGGKNISMQQHDLPLILAVSHPGYRGIRDRLTPMIVDLSGGARLGRPHMLIGDTDIISGSRVEAIGTVADGAVFVFGAKPPGSRCTDVYAIDVRCEKICAKISRFAGDSFWCGGTTIVACEFVGRTIVMSVDASDIPARVTRVAKTCVSHLLTEGAVQRIVARSGTEFGVVYQTEWGREIATLEFDGAGLGAAISEDKGFDACDNGPSSRLGTHRLALLRSELAAYSARFGAVDSAFACCGRMWGDHVVPVVEVRRMFGMFSEFVSFDFGGRGAPRSKILPLWLRPDGARIRETGYGTFLITGTGGSVLMRAPACERMMEFRDAADELATGPGGIVVRRGVSVTFVRTENGDFVDAGHFASLWRFTLTPTCW